jgi:predicted neutral ceramidase superfamily lipid hydrolase
VAGRKKILPAATTPRSAFLALSTLTSLSSFASAARVTLELRKHDPQVMRRLLLLAFHYVLFLMRSTGHLL